MIELAEIPGETTVTAEVPAQSVQISPTAPIAASTAPTTSAEDDRKTAGQRAINLKWESTQQAIAVAVSVVVLLTCAFIVVAGEPTMRPAAFLFLTNIMTGVTTTYFVRTNHTKTGGVGANELGR